MHLYSNEQSILSTNMLDVKHVVMFLWIQTETPLSSLSDISTVCIQHLQMSSVWPSSQPQAKHSSWFLVSFRTNNVIYQKFTLAQC